MAGLPPMPGYRLAMTGEGFETERQRKVLVAFDCHHLQDYLLGRPSPTLLG